MAKGTPPAEGFTALDLTGVFGVPQTFTAKESSVVYRRVVRIDPLPRSRVEVLPGIAIAALPRLRARRIT